MKTVDKVLLSMDKPMVDEILLNGGIKLFIDPSFNPEFNVTVEGIVEVKPKKATKINVGDKVCFSYRVVSDTDVKKSSERFMPTVEESPYVKKFIDGNDRKLSVIAMPAVFGKFNKIWVGLLVDKFGNRVDGIQGNESEVERWMAQFDFAGVQDLKFNNLMELSGKDYWKTELDEIFAKQVGDSIEAVGDRVIMTPVDIDVKTRIEILNGITLPNSSVKVRYFDRGVVVSGGEDLGLKAGDTASFKEDFLEKYNFFGKEYFVVKKKRILGVWDN